MAFQQSTRQPVQRLDRNEPGHVEPAAVNPQDRPTPNEFQKWVVFTPGTDAGTTSSYLNTTQDGQLTPGRSRISDLGSLDTVARSEFDLQAASEVVSASVAEEDAELDSLDSHLPEFRIVPNPYNQPEVAHATPVLPGHDGLGSFRFETPGMSAEAQDRMYAFERFNPNRVGHRSEGFNLAQLETQTEEAQDWERNHRIEAWRLEQSQLLLEDIRSETRKRQQSEESLRGIQHTKSMQPEVAERSVADDEAADINLSGADWHDQDEPTRSGAKPGSWSQMARKFIRDMMGVDDELLAVLFGDAVPDEEMLSSTPQASATGAFAPAPGRLGSESSHDSEWQLRMLDRISRELGALVHQMSTHPGAFSTYTRVQHMALPYAGLPVIPETPADVSDSGRKMESSVQSMPQFKPTVGRPADVLSARPSEPPTPPGPSASDMNPSDTQHTFTQQEWEQDLDVRLVFRYLRSRFTSSRQASPSFSSGTSHLATSSTQDTAAKAARVRQHHPLVSHAHTHAHAHGYHRTRPVERRSFKATVPPSPVAIRHPPGSCASQSTRRSARRSSISSRPSSRHYWDIGGSIKTGSAIASTGPMGSWGEV
ncbi:hypothetical protein F5144DRAFT_564883 [Chaetomium tenue]|uniref:Uncharacterized protein n=1 Tax=Chaetomium tenue TaxID=1854479 RepID=A0ACB7PJL8_9PEZI|nr:hypothetical protein F5144DRAFT_564883 [Chaetomium globosum]